MFNKYAMKIFDKYLIFWLFWCFTVAMILIFLDVDISKSTLANFLKDSIPAMKLLEQSTKYPQLAVSIWSICWVSGIIFLIVIIYKFEDSLIDYTSRKLIEAGLVLLFLSIWPLYFGLWSSLPDTHSGRLSQIFNLTQFGIISHAIVVWTVFILSMTTLISIIIKSLRKIFYGK
jgi:hypothetical protein